MSKQRSMSNIAQALNAIMQIQQGMETLRQTAPSLVNTFGIPVPPSTTGATPASDATNTDTTTTTTTATPTTITTDSNPTTTQPSVPQGADPFTEVCLKSTEEIN